MAGAPSQARRRAAFGFVLVNVWLDVLALGVIIQVQGRLRGANAGIDSTAGIIGPALFGGAYAWFVGGHGVVLPGAAFLLAAGLHAAASILSLPVMGLARARAGKPTEVA